MDLTVLSAERERDPCWDQGPRLLGSLFLDGVPEREFVGPFAGHSSFIRGLTCGMDCYEPSLYAKAKYSARSDYFKCEKLLGSQHIRLLQLPPSPPLFYNLRSTIGHVYLDDQVHYEKLSKMN